MAGTREVPLFLLISDESNPQPRGEIPWFVYGGVFLRSELALSLNDAVGLARSKVGMKSDGVLKFTYQRNYTNLPSDEHKRLTDTVLRLAAEHDVGLVGAAVHRDRATAERYTEWNTNQTLHEFLTMLRQQNAAGIVIADRVQDSSLPDHANWYRFAAEKFSVGLKYKDRIVPLDRVVMYSQTAQGLSHLNSACDIAVGAVRYIVNALGVPEPNPTSCESCQRLGPMVWALASQHPEAQLDTFGQHGLMLLPARSRGEPLYVDLIRRVQRCCRGQSPS